ncbi:DNA methyltransferase [Carnobacterium divergens]|uniref:class I SAM-dependent DNA methyltransferase n=1 Tax=Carnobacterium divergens TaxID=2748 RepID=UPI000D4126D1|nr:DNA methyltransferase [Carnobacterium divergens]MCO6016916.1 N-6 DNA methylase [Carnobacterium divergens]TFI62545.1 DNA methyltransferase [Carnobacterium divergens]TFI89747.1 DNA methyltransferase [Carnobacterium divergens]TFJ04802.1 DNA methyltransferase [Carnobacterium divergens]TFJ06292.1 DNA methyltransferase [Carnobacterium divergens]
MLNKNLLSIIEVENITKKIIENLNKETFIEEFLGLFDIPKLSITRAKSSEGDFFIRNKVRYRKVENDPLCAIDEIDKEIVLQNKKPRYLITTDFKMLYAKDTKTNDSLAINFKDLPTSIEFFLAWNGIEKADFQKENPADIKAAERFTKLYDELVKINPELAKEEADGKSFNLFLIRSLFLYFSEDTEIITKGSFTNILKTRTKSDGSNLNSVIKKLFLILDIPENQRHDTPEWLKEFPYINGNLFRETHHDLNFSAFTRKLLIEAGELLNWNEINPDILGAMIQTVANKEERQVSGMHYTSVSNIMKVINPLFLDSLQAEYKRLSYRAGDYKERDISEKQRREKQRDIINQLYGLLDQMSKIKFLDPACGSGNFLIITYKELRRLEIQILVKIREINEVLNEKNVYQGDLLKRSKIRLNQFSGIELDDFAHEVARLSLYIAEHQMNVEMMESLADYQPRILPLQESGNIVQGNALHIDWNEVVAYDKNDEIYIMGNPPYIGSRNQTEENKKEMSIIFDGVKSFKKLDYISAWFLLGVKFIEDTKSKFAFVTTNSITQGEQVPILWKKLLSYNIEIYFAYNSFKWSNSASNNAGVTVAIIGIASKGENNSKYLLSEGESIEVANITPYLSYGDIVLVENSTIQFSGFPKMQKGNGAYDNGFLTFSISEYEDIVSKIPETKNFFKKYVSADDIINGTYKYCLWISDENLFTAQKIPFINSRIEKVKMYRLSSKREVTKQQAETPYAFGEIRYKKGQGFIIPVVSSEAREYLPIAIIDSKVIPSYATFVLYDAPIWLLGILESRMHMTWLRAVGGKLETRYRYSTGIVYNTFPIPKLSTQRKNVIEEAVLEMLDVREEEGGTLAELYGGANKPMNTKLRKAHKKIDGIVERAYKQEPFKSDEERLSVLLRLYQKMINEEKK